MTSKNPNSLTGQGEFSARRPGASPMDKHGHQPGVKASPNDSIPTFSAQTLSPGTAPLDKTYAPQTGTREGLETNIDPLEGMSGATSGDLHAGMGKPMQGMTSEELRHDGQQGRKRQTLGLAKHGAGVDERVDERQRGVEREVRPGRG